MIPAAKTPLNWERWKLEISPIVSRKSKIVNEWLLLCALIFISRLLNLDVFLTPDEPLFLEHARAFATGVASGHFSDTLGIGYPGVTVAAVAAWPVSAAATEMGAYAAGRAAVAMLTGLLLVALFALARRLWGCGPAFIGVALLALDPFALGYSRLLHIAAPLALLMTLTGLTFVLWLSDARRRWLILTGLFTGLALLTKSTALLLGPMLAVMTVGWGLSTGSWRHWGWWRQIFGAGLVIVLTAVAVFTALWPAMWIDPATTIALTFGKLFTDQQAGTGNMGMFWLGQFVQDPGPWFYPVAFLLKGTPWLLLGLTLSLYYLFKTYANVIPRSVATKNLHPKDSELPTEAQNEKLRVNGANSPFIMPLWLFALTYLILMTIASKKSVRYLLPAFPTFYLLAGQALTEFSRRCCRIFDGLNNSQFTIYNSQFTIGRLLFVFVILIQIVVSCVYHPYYFTYYNPLVLGWRWAPSTLLVGWGEGLDGAARYLQTQPPGTVATWYEWLFPQLSGAPVKPVVPAENLLTADYAVLYINQVQRDIPNPNIIHYFRTRRQPAHTVRLAGIDYAWVYPGPVVGPKAGPPPQTSLAANFGDALRLTGYDLPPVFRSGDPAVVTLHWQVLIPPPAERFVFVRLLDPQGRVWAASDRPPVMGLWPVDRWQPGIFMADAHSLALPSGLPPGPYRLEVGVYNPADGQPLPPSGAPTGPGGGLLLGEVSVKWQANRTPPDLPHTTDTRLAPNARLTGYDAPPASAITGDLLPIRLAWRESQSLAALWVMPNDLVMFEWRADGKRVAEQLAPLPLPLDDWGRGAVLLSRHEVMVPPALETGSYELFAMLHTGSDPAGEPFRLGSVTVTAPPHQFDLPADTQLPVGSAQLAEGVSLAGYNLTPTNGQLELRLYWQTSAPLPTRYKVFVQLLAVDNSVLAQSDQFPAGGERPTTGWLPGEIITDGHTLTLAPDVPPGSYRLIAGLYDPLTGQRLSLRDTVGAPFADAIFLTELSE